MIMIGVDAHKRLHTCVAVEELTGRQIGMVGDFSDNALAEALVDFVKTELIAERVWRIRSELELELAVGEHIPSFITCVHEGFGDIPLQVRRTPRQCTAITQVNKHQNL